MTVSESQSGSDPRLEGILTLAEAAAYLRVSEVELAELAARNGLPARKLGGEWRFLRRALDDWMRFSGGHPAEYWREYPYWLLESPFADEVIHLLEARLLDKLQQTTPPVLKRGSKQAILKHYGVFRDDGDLEERLADARKRREEEG
jgi:excisionase family DNA binding protein